MPYSTPVDYEAKIRGWTAEFVPFSSTGKLVLVTVGVPCTHVSLRAESSDDAGAFSFVLDPTFDTPGKVHTDPNVGLPLVLDQLHTEPMSQKVNGDGQTRRFMMVRTTAGAGTDGVWVQPEYEPAGPRE